MYHKGFKHLSSLDSIEVAKPKIVVLIPKNHIFLVFFAVFSGTARELRVPTMPPNTRPRPHLMQKEPIDVLNFPRRWTISGVQKVTLYYKIDIVIQLFRCLYKWSLAPRIYKTLDLLFLIQENQRYQPIKNWLCTQLGVTLKPCILATNQDFEN